MKLPKVVEILKCKGQFPDTPIKGYCTDSRLIKPGDLFFALKGERVDGHDYLEEVQKRGAIAAVVSKHTPIVFKNFPLFVVNDPLLSLQELARILLSQSSSHVVAITGSIGKTTTKEFTKTLLATKYLVAASPGNSNSQVGLPLTILNHTTGKEEILVLEMGMTHPGNIARLIQIAPPEVAVITCIALVHACNFESLEEIAGAKAEIFSHPNTRLGILHRDIPNFLDICQQGLFPKVSFSITGSADYRFDFSSNSIEARLENKIIPLRKLSIPGKHNYHNLLAAIAIAKYFDIEWEKIQQAITHLVLPERRLQFVHHKGILFINDSYNANEQSMMAAFQTLVQTEEKGRKIAVIGSMLELGKFSDECHEWVGQLALNYVDHMYCLGEECLPIYQIWKEANRSVQFFKNRLDLVACLKEELQTTDIVLLKGSRSKELWKILEEY